MSECRALLWLALLLLAGCHATPVWREPTVPTQAKGGFVSVTDLTNPLSEPPADWWRLYDDPELTAVVVEALNANTDVRVALANLTFARAIVQEARAGRYPTTQLTGGLIYGRNLIADSVAAVLHGHAENQTTTLLGFDISYEVDLYGRVASTIEAANADAQAVAAAADMVRVVVAAETTRAWASVRNAARELAVARRSAQIADEAVEIVVRQISAGAASDFDLARVRVVADQAHAQLPVFEGRRDAARLELTALLGRTPADVPANDARNTTVRLSTPLPIGDGAQLLGRRPDVRQAERRLAASSARVGVATASLYPRFTLGANIGYASNDVLRNSNTVNLAVGPLFSVSFPNQAAARARIAQGDAAAAAALATFDGTVLRALKEVEQAITACGVESSRGVALDAAETHAAESYRLARVRHREGAASQLEVITAEQTWLVARSAAAAADTRLVDAQITLFKALGGGWQVHAGRAN